MRKLLGVLLASATLLASPIPVYAWYYGVPYRSSAFEMQATDWYCVPASSVTWVNYIYGYSNHGKTIQDEYYGKATANDKYSYPATAGTDPRGWAWVMWYKAPGGYNDYRYSSQSSGDSELMWNIRNTHKPAGALVASGHHAFLVTGFQATQDPVNNGSLQGFYINDPWFGRGNSGLPGVGTGLAPNTYVSLTNWNSTFFTRYDEDVYPVTFWNNYYVVVLRKSTTTAPTDTPDAPYGQSSLLSPEVTTAEEPTGAESMTAAVTDGIDQHDLLNSAEFGAVLADYSIGAAQHVDSLDPAIPSYYLVELRRDDKLVALAMVLEEADGFHFGGVREVSSGSGLLSPEQARASMHIAANSAVHAAWAWSPDTYSPFAPMWISGSGNQQRVLVPDGRVIAQPQLFHVVH